MNYRSITQSPHYEQCKKLIDQTGKQRSKIIWLLILIPIFWIPLLIWALMKIPGSGKMHREIQQSLTAFAAENGFTYQEISIIQHYGKDLPDVELLLPYKAKLLVNSGYMKGNFKNLQFDYLTGTIELIDYKGLSAQSGSHETRSIVAMYVTLPIELPKLLLDTKRNNIFGFEVKANRIEALQEYNLEGDFPKHYRVFAEKNDQINVLSILTPEVMAKLLEYKYFDVWIEGNKLVVFSNGVPYEYFAAFPIIFPTVDMLLNEIDKIARSLRS